MEKERIEKVKKHIRTEAALEAGQVLKKITDNFPDNPEGMKYFYDLLSRQFSEEILPKNGKKLIGTMCVQVPDELILAAGAKPVRVCSGSFPYDNAGAEFMPAKTCSMIKAIMGLFQVEDFREKFDMLVIPTTCDQKKKTTEILKDMGYEAYSLAMPSRKDDDNSRYYWQNSVKEFAADLMKKTGNKITKESLKKAFDLKNEARYEFRRLFKLRMKNPAVIYGKDAFLIANAYFTDDIESWTAALKKLNDELEKKVEEGFSVANAKVPRFLFTGSPPIFPNMKIPLLVEEAGGLIAIDEVCSSSRLLYDMPSYDEQGLYDMIPAIADCYLKPCTCPCFVPNEERKDKISNLIDMFNIDGVIYQAFSGCQLYEMEQKLIGNFLMKKGVPMLYIESDYSPEDTGQLSTRVEAFIESIKMKKKSSAAKKEENKKDKK
ncbi:MAG: double-cubane-cluster-containing anaerobic reductase [Spirochaetia bacterium]|nr:double-cubane-cluster-containing anaerobic reductase [Spirochaetia bacterium]